MVTVEQSFHFTPAASPAPGTLGSAVSIGDVIIVALRNSTANPTAVTDSLGNTYTQIDTQVVSAAVNAYVFYSKVTNAGTPTITLTSTGGGGFRAEVVVLSGCDLTNPLGQHNKNASASTTGVSGNITTTSPKGMLVGSYVMFGAVTAFTQGSGYTFPAPISNADTEVQMETQNVSATGTYSAPMSWTGGTISYGGFVAFFLDANQTGGTPIPVIAGGGVL